MAYIESESVSAAPYRGQKASTAEESIMNNVNLYRGSVASNITLVSLDGMDGLDLTVGALYRPERSFPKPNRLCAGSVFGTGMMMPLAAILAKNRTKRQTYQSDFYTTGEGGNFPLYRKGRNGGAVEFLSVEHPFWKYRMFEDRWEVLKDDGSVWTYGGTADSLEINICWGNWTGPCRDMGGEEFPVGWYLSKVTSSHGNSIHFEYENIKQPLGGSFYTLEMHLKAAVSAFGQVVRLNYLPKKEEEYELPHDAEAGAYQFLCERHYLDSVSVYSAKGSLLYEQKLFYDLIPGAPGELKRLLTSASQVSKDGEVLLPLTIQWEKKGGYAGHILKITYPRNGALEFGYSELEAAGYEPAAFLECGEGLSRSIVNGPDFTAALFAGDSFVKLKILSWDMSWQIYKDEFFQNRTVRDAGLFLGNGIVVVRYLSASDNYYALRILKRVPVRRFDWEGFDVPLGSPVCPGIACGSDFVAVQYPDRNGLKIYQFNYLDNLWHDSELPVEAMGHQMIGAGDGCLFGAYGYDNSRYVRLMTFYSDESHQWHIGGTLDLSADVSWDYEASLPVWSVSGSIASACFISDRGDHIDAVMIAVSWDTDFQVHVKEVLNVSQPITTGNPISYSIAADTMIGFANTAFRYTPAGFIRHTLFNVSGDCEYAYAYGSDLMLGVERRPDGNQRFSAARFDPVLGAWTDDGVPYAEEVSSLSGLCHPLVASDYAVLGRYVFLRGADERWTSLGALPEEADITSVRLDAGGSYLLYSIPQANITRFVPLSPAGFGKSEDIPGGKTGDYGYYEAGSSCFFLSSIKGQAPGVGFYNLIAQKYESETPKAMCLGSITLDSGLDRQTVFFDYDMDSARLENGVFAAGTAAVLPVSRDGSFGRTVYSYFNGAAPSRVEYPPADPYCNAADFYTHFEGQLRSTVSYDGDGAKLSESRCYMKAYDSHGFCIQQAKICKSDFVKRFSLDMRDVGDVWDEIQSSVEYEYEQKYYRRQKVLQSSFDKSGKEVILSQSLSYAFQHNPDLEDANRLNDVSLSRLEDVTERVTLDASRYEYGKNAAGYYYQTAEYTMGRTEGEWLEVKTATAVDRRCKVLCERDERGLPTSTLYDRNGLYPVAVTKYAEPDEVLYCGFEPYESMERLKIDGASAEGSITMDNCYSGTGCLRLLKRQKLVFGIRVRDGGMHLRVSLKTGNTVFVSVDFGGGDVSEAVWTTEDSWAVCSENFYAKGKSDHAAVTICTDSEILLDALYVTPVLAEGEAYVYTGGLMLQTASHLNYGPGTRTYFDRYDTPCVHTGDDGLLHAVTNKIYGAAGTPCEMYTLKPSSWGGWYDSRQGYTPNPLFKPGGAGWEFMDAGHFALLFLAGAAKPSVAFGDVRLSWSGDVWTLKNGAETESAPAPRGEYYLLLKMGNRCRFYGDGVILFTFTCGGNMLHMSDTSGISCIGYLPDPNVSLSCADCTGRVWQDQIVTEGGVRIVHTIYNELGVILARTTQVEVPDVFWGYRSGYVTGYSRETGETDGEINSFFPESERYPCTSFKTTYSSSPEVKELAQPGKSFAFDSGFTVKHGRRSAGGLPAVIEDGYCSGEVTTDPDGMATFNLSDGRGKVLSGRVSADGTTREITAYELDARGHETKVYYPNYFSGDGNGNEFVSVITYDALGNVASRKDPDGDLVLSVYNRYGNLRFISQEEAGGQYIYHLYDKLGRKTEMGYVNAPWDGTALYREADQESLRPDGGTPVKLLFYDEAPDSGKPVNQVGQLTRVVTRTGGKTVEERYEYDSYKRQIRYALLVDGRMEECLTSYNDAGNVVTRRTGNPADGVLDYGYGVNGELTQVRYNGQIIYGCGYTSQGSLASETFGDHIKRDYNYNTANYLTGIKGTYLNQQLTYFSSGSEGTKNSGQISEVRTQMDGPRVKNRRLSVGYDPLGRVVSAAFNGADPAVCRYDANGNQLRDGLTYQTGTDRFTSVDGEAVSYEGYGAVKGIGNRMQLQYEPVTQMARSVSFRGLRTEYRIGNGICGFDVDGILTLSVQSEDGKLFYERRSGGGAAILVYGANGVFAQILDGRVYYLIKDYRSSVCGVADNDSLLASYDYDLFGGIMDQWESRSLPDGLIPLRFAGARLERTGLYRFKLRLYDPYSGRFLSPDPENQYPNPYIYGGCDWINYFDPDGAFNVGGFLASLFVGLALIAVGVAVTVATAGMGGAAGVALGVVAAGVLGAGISSAIYSVTSAINDDFSWSGWGIQMGAGAVFGMVSAGIGAAMPATMGAAGSVAYDFVSGMIVGTADGVVTNGLLNLSNGKEFLDHVLTNAITGAVMGGVLGAVTGMSTAARNAKSMVRNGGADVKQLGFSNKGCHTKVGVRRGNAGVASNTTHLTASPNAAGTLMADISYTNMMHNSPKWINVKNSVYTGADASMNAAIGPYGRYNLVFNNCTGYAIKISANAGIYQPLWARTPATMNWWVSLTRAFQR